VQSYYVVLPANPPAVAGLSPSGGQLTIVLGVATGSEVETVASRPPEGKKDDEVPYNALQQAGMIDACAALTNNDVVRMVHSPHPDAE